MLTIVLIGIFVACLAILFAEGLWTNAIRLVNVVTAALLATNLWEPLAGKLDALAPSLTYYWDFLTIWALFVGSFWGLRAATEAVSKVKVRFLPLLDRIGGAVFAASTGWVMVCFTLMSLHLAPLAREFLNGGFKAEEPMFLGTAPDRLWLGFVQEMSRGALARSSTASEARQEQNVFDPRGEFLLKYASRRAQLEKHVRKNGTFLVNRDEPP